MALVKLTNVGDESFVGVFDGKEYIVDPDEKGKSFIIIDAKIAKHWFGDWDEKDELLKAAEAKRIKMYTRESPKPGWKINIDAVKENQKSDDRKRYRPPTVKINPLISAPNEEEFPGLKDIQAKAKEVKSKV